jgi:4-carboxymuconolactone decarboxylase
VVLPKESHYLTLQEITESVMDLIEMKNSLVIVLFLCLASVGHTQDRMPPIPVEDLTSEQAAAVAELVAARGYGPQGPWVSLLRSPEVLNRARAMGDYMRYNTSLTPRLSEFVILMTASEWGQAYEWYAHHQIALDAGLDRDIVIALAEGQTPEGLAEDEELLYAFFGELNNDRSVSDGTYARMLSMFGEKGVIDTVGIIGYYTLLAMAMNTAQTPAPGPSDPELK